MSDLRVLHIVTGLNVGGAEAALYRLTTGDRANRHHVISLMDAGVYGRQLQEAGILLDTLQMPRGRITFHGVAKLYRLIKATKPDVIQTWMYHADLIGGFVARLAGVKHVVWSIRCSNVNAASTSRSARYVQRLCALGSAWVPAKVISCSVEAARVHATFGYRRDKLVVIANGYNVDQLAPDPQARARVRKEFATPEDVVLFGMIARWHPDKDHGNLIGALGRLKARGGRPWRCLLVGSGMTKENTDLLTLLRAHDVLREVRLAGPRSDIASIMNAVDVHVLSSNTEAFPNVLCEAMACGTPCVTTDVGDAGLIVGDTGWLVPRARADALAEAMLAAADEMTHAGRWQVKQHSVRERILQNFSLERMINGYADVWRSVGAREGRSTTAVAPRPSRTPPGAE